MGTLKESAMAYEGQGKMKNITELPRVNTNLELESKELKNRDGETFRLDFIVVNGEEYRVPASVLKSLKVMLEENPNLKEFKVKSSGTGLDTTYTVIPLL